jgi:hypothetical protein
MGFSCFVDIPGEGFLFKVSAGRYKLHDVTVTGKDGNPVSLRGYLREPLDSEINIAKAELPNRKARSVNFDIKKNNEPTGPVMNIRNRTPERKLGESNQIYTFTLINTLKSSGSHIDNDNCFFQTGFSVRAKDNSPCFSPYPMRRNVSEHSDDKSSSLLYRNYKTFAIGHGCSPSWTEKDRRAAEIRTEIIPIFEMKPIVPARFADLQLKMYDLCDYGNPDGLISSLFRLCEKYDSWISSQETIARNELSGDLQETALTHIENCKKCLSRIREGINPISTEQSVRRAFTLMNRAMLLQQLRYGLKLREWKIRRDRSLEIEKADYPDIHRPETWPDWSESEQRNKKYGSWYPFQIAFILMNLKSIALPQSDNRKIVDLIWFPTGGGKTEAYLGLTAFTIFLKRLRNMNAAGQQC